MDDFTALISKIESLRKEHAQLELSLPRTAELKRQAEGDLATLNKKLATVLAQLDTAQTELVNLQATLAADREKHDSELLLERRLFIAQRKTTLDELERQLAVVQERITALDERAKLLVEGETALKSAETTLNARNTILDASIANLKSWEKQTVEANQEAVDRLAAVEVREDALVAREAAVEAQEQSAAEVVRQADAKLKQTQHEADVVSNRALRVEAKEHEIIQRETVLVTRKKQLDQRELGVQDKEAVRASRMI